MIFKSAAVIGANGFIGSNLVKHLQNVEDIDITLYGRSSVSKAKGNYAYRQMDVTDKTQVDNIFLQADIVFYLVSESIPLSTWSTPVAEVEKNLIPFLNFLDRAAALGVKKIVFTSSAGTIYGTTTDQANEDAFKNPFSPHGIVKLAMEYFLNYAKIRYGLAFDIYRIANCYGPGQNTSKGLGIINTFLENIISGDDIQVFGDGEAIRNYIYVDDIARIMMGSLISLEGNIYNAASSDHLSIRQIIEVIQRVIPEQVVVAYNDGRKSDNPAIYLDNAKIVRAMPELTYTTIEEGIRATYQHLMAIRALE